MRSSTSSAPSWLWCNRTCEKDIVLFPAVLSRTWHASRADRDVHALGQEHFVIGDRLAYIRSLTDDFAMPNGGESYRALVRHLSSFDDDLRRCVHLENHLLMPQSAKRRAHDGS